MSSTGESLGSSSGYTRLSAMKPDPQVVRVKGQLQVVTNDRRERVDRVISKPELEQLKKKTIQQLHLECQAAMNDTLSAIQSQSIQTKREWMEKEMPLAISALYANKPVVIPVDYRGDLLDEPRLCAYLEYLNSRDTAGCKALDPLDDGEISMSNLMGFGKLGASGLLDMPRESLMHEVIVRSIVNNLNIAFENMRLKLPGYVLTCLDDYTDGYYKPDVTIIQVEPNGKQTEVFIEVSALSFSNLKLKHNLLKSVINYKNDASTEKVTRMYFYVKYKTLSASLTQQAQSTEPDLQVDLLNVDVNLKDPSPSLILSEIDQKKQETSVYLRDIMKGALNAAKSEVFSMIVDSMCNATPVILQKETELNFSQSNRAPSIKKDAIQTSHGCVFAYMFSKCPWLSCYLSDLKVIITTSLSIMVNNGDEASQSKGGSVQPLTVCMHPKSFDVDSLMLRFKTNIKGEGCSYLRVRRDCHKESRPQIEVEEKMSKRTCVFAVTLPDYTSSAKKLNLEFKKGEKTQGLGLGKRSYIQAETFMSRSLNKNQEQSDCLLSLRDCFDSLLTNMSRFTENTITTMKIIATKVCRDSVIRLFCCVGESELLESLKANMLEVEKSMAQDDPAEFMRTMRGVIEGVRALSSELNLTLYPESDSFSIRQSDSQFSLALNEMMKVATQMKEDKLRGNNHDKAKYKELKKSISKLNEERIMNSKVNAFEKDELITKGLRGSLLEPSSKLIEDNKWLSGVFPPEFVSRKNFFKHHLDDEVDPNHEKESGESGSDNEDDEEIESKAISVDDEDIEKLCSALTNYDFSKQTATGQGIFTTSEKTISRMLQELKDSVSEYKTWLIDGLSASMSEYMGIKFKSEDVIELENFLKVIDSNLDSLISIWAVAPRWLVDLVKGRMNLARLLMESMQTRYKGDMTFDIMSNGVLIFNVTSSPFTKKGFSCEVSGFLTNPVRNQGAFVYTSHVFDEIMVNSLVLSALRTVTTYQTFSTAFNVGGLQVNENVEFKYSILPFVSLFTTPFRRVQEVARLQYEVMKLTSTANVTNVGEAILSLAEKERYNIDVRLILYILYKHWLSRGMETATQLAEQEVILPNGSYLSLWKYLDQTKVDMILSDARMKKPEGLLKFSSSLSFTDTFRLVAGLAATSGGVKERSNYHVNRVTAEAYRAEVDIIKQSMLDCCGYGDLDHDYIMSDIFDAEQLTKGCFNVSEGVVVELCSSLNEWFQEGGFVGGMFENKRLEAFLNYCLTSSVASLLNRCACYYPFWLGSNCSSSIAKATKLGRVDPTINSTLFDLDFKLEQLSEFIIKSTCTAPVSDLATSAGTGEDVTLPASTHGVTMAKPILKKHLEELDSLMSDGYFSEKVRLLCAARLNSFKKEKKTRENVIKLTSMVCAMLIGGSFEKLSEEQKTFFNDTHVTAMTGRIKDLISIVEGRCPWLIPPSYSVEQVNLITKALVSTSGDVETTFCFIETLLAIYHFNNSTLDGTLMLDSSKSRVANRMRVVFNKYQVSKKISDMLVGIERLSPQEAQSINELTADFNVEVVKPNMSKQEAERVLEMSGFMLDIKTILHPKQQFGGGRPIEAQSLLMRCYTWFSKRAVEVISNKMSSEDPTSFDSEITLQSISEKVKTISDYSASAKKAYDLYDEVINSAGFNSLSYQEYQEKIQQVVQASGIQKFMPFLQHTNPFLVRTQDEFADKFEAMLLVKTQELKKFSDVVEQKTNFILPDGSGTSLLTTYDASKFTPQMATQQTMVNLFAMHPKHNVFNGVTLSNVGVRMTVSDMLCPGYVSSEKLLEGLDMMITGAENSDYHEDKLRVHMRFLGITKFVTDSRGRLKYNVVMRNRAPQGAVASGSSVSVLGATDPLSASIRNSDDGSKFSLGEVHMSTPTDDRVKLCFLSCLVTLFANSSSISVLPAEKKTGMCLFALLMEIIFHASLQGAIITPTVCQCVNNLASADISKIDSVGESCDGALASDVTVRMWDLILPSLLLSTLTGFCLNKIIGQCGLKRIDVKSCNSYMSPFNHLPCPPTLRRLVNGATFCASYNDVKKSDRQTVDLMRNATKVSAKVDKAEMVDLKALTADSRSNLAKLYLAFRSCLSFAASDYRCLSDEFMVRYENKRHMITLRNMTYGSEMHSIIKTIQQVKAGSTLYYNGLIVATTNTEVNNLCLSLTRLRRARTNDMQDLLLSVNEEIAPLIQLEQGRQDDEDNLKVFEIVKGTHFELYMSKYQELSVGDLRSTLGTHGYNKTKKFKRLEELSQDETLTFSKVNLFITNKLAKSSFELSESLHTTLKPLLTAWNKLAVVCLMNDLKQRNFKLPSCTFHPSLRQHGIGSLQVPSVGGKGQEFTTPSISILRSNSSQSLKKLLRAGTIISSMTSCIEACNDTDVNISNLIIEPRVQLILSLTYPCQEVLQSICNLYSERATYPREDETSLPTPKQKFIEIDKKAIISKIAPMWTKAVIDEPFTAIATLTNQEVLTKLMTCFDMNTRVESSWVNYVTKMTNSNLRISKMTRLVAGLMDCEYKVNKINLHRQSKEALLEQANLGEEFRRSHNQILHEFFFNLNNDQRFPTTSKISVKVLYSCTPSGQPTSKSIIFTALSSNAFETMTRRLCELTERFGTLENASYRLRTGFDRDKKHDDVILANVFSSVASVMKFYNLEMSIINTDISRVGRFFIRENLVDGNTMVDSRGLSNHKYQTVSNLVFQLSYDLISSVTARLYKRGQTPTVVVGSLPILSTVLTQSNNDVFLKKSYTEWAGKFGTLNSRALMEGMVYLLTLMVKLGTSRKVTAALISLKCFVGDRLTGATIEPLEADFDVPEPDQIEALTGMDSTQVSTIPEGSTSQGYSNPTESESTATSTGGSVSTSVPDEPNERNVQVTVQLSPKLITEVANLSGTRLWIVNGAEVPAELLMIKPIWLGLQMVKRNLTSSEKAVSFVHLKGNRKIRVKGQPKRTQAVSGFMRVEFSRVGIDSTTPGLPISSGIVETSSLGITLPDRYELTVEVAEGFQFESSACVITNVDIPDTDHLAFTRLFRYDFSSPSYLTEFLDACFFISCVELNS